MNIDRSKHNKYTAGAVYGNLTTGGISTDEVGNVTGTGLLYSGNIIYVGGGGGSIDPALIEKMLNQNAYSYMNIGNGVNTERTEAKQEKDYINLNIVGDHETVDTEISKDRYLNKTLFDATGLKGGRYGVTYKKILVPGETSGEPVEIPKWVITLEKIFGNPIFSELDFNGVQIFNGNVEVGVYSINNPKVTVNQDDVTGLVSIVISNPEPLDFTELRIIKAGEYIDTTTFSNIAIISNIVILEYVTVTITLAGATKYWKIDDQGRLYTTYDTYTTKSLGAYDKIWTNYGYTVGNYVLGLSGGAFYITDKLQNTYLEVDKLKVRKKAYFETLEIVNVNSVGGKLIISPAGAVTLNKVEDKGTYYRCYFLGTQDGVEVENRFKSNDLAFSLNFNIKKPGEYELVANHYFWRKINNVSIDPDANGNHWIDLDKIDCDTDSDIPHINDVVAQLGNKTDTDRLSAMIFSSVDAESPRIILCHGINTYSLSSKEYFDLGVNHLTNLAYMNVYGNSFVGARDGSTYVKYTLTDGLQIKGKISASSTYGDKAFSEVFVTTENFDDSVKAVIGEDLEFLQNLIDGNIESYFYEYSPTLTNYPANTWLTTADKLRHNGDTFTNIQKYVNDATTPDAGKSWRWVKNASNVWGWTPISDSDAVLALKKAGEALDTADGKRRVFTRKPETADIYDIGDLWVNATYTDTVGLMVYSNDLLRAKKAKVKGIAFNITDWELASKYTDDTAANAAKQDAAAALAAATAAGAAATAALTTINNYKDTIDDVFQDGIITASEKNRLNSLRDTVNTTLFDVLTTYNKVYHNINLESTVLKTRLKTAYDTFSIAAKALVDAVTTILTKVVNSLYSITKGDIATIDNAYTNFNTKYTDYVGALGDANLQITTAIGNTSYTNAVNKYAWLNGLFDPNLTTTIEGGVVTTGVLALGKTTSGVFKVNAGINGASNSAYLGSGPAIWFGGDMLDKDNYSAGNRPANVATSMFRFDGSGYLGYKPTSVVAKDQAPIWWDATGNIHANPLSFFVGEETVGLLLASFLAVDSTGDGLVDYIVQKAPFTYLQIGNGYIGYDAANNAVYVYVLDSSGNKLICNFYAYGEVSAYGGDSSGKPPAGALYLDELKDVQFTSLTSGQILGYNGSKWVNIDKPASGASSWADITGKPTTLAGYGITDGVLTSDIRLTNARPASDVYAWAKTSIKPNYSYSEITGTPPTPDLSKYVTLNTPQSITENKKWTNGVSSLMITTDGIITIDVTTTGAWARGIEFYGNSALAGKFGAFGGPAGLQYIYIGDDYNNTWFNINRYEPTFTVTGNVVNVKGAASDLGFRVVQNASNKANFGWSTVHGTYMYNYSSNKIIRITDSGIPSFSGNTLLHAGNYNSYAPSLTGSNASGYWNITSAYSTHSSALLSVYTGSGGAQPPSYFNGFGLKVNMMNIPVAYCDVIVVNGYGGTGSDVPYINAIAFEKTSGNHGPVFHARGGYGASSWGTWHRFLDSYNYNSYSPTLTGTGASGTWGISITGNLAATNPQLAAGYESNEITVINNTSVNNLNHAIKFRWYNNYYQLGIVRGSGTDDLGFAICRDTTPLVRFQPSVLSAMTTIQATVKNSIQADGVILVNTNRLANNNYTEGIRMVSAPNGWSNIHFNTAASWEGFQTGQWIIGRNPGNAFIIAYAGKESSTGTWKEGNVLIDSSGTLNAKNLIARDGLLQSICNGNVVTIGSQNGGWCHFQSGVTYHFDKSIAVAGDVYPYTANAYACGRDGIRWSSVWTNNVQFRQVDVVSTWPKILQTSAGLNANIRGDGEYVAVNTDQLILRWQNLLPVGYRTTYGISSARGTSGYGVMRIFVAGSDAQTAGRSLMLGADGSMAWEGSFTVGANSITCGPITASGHIRGGEIYANGWFRSNSSGCGWYNEAHAGGMYMIDNEQVRVYNNKVLFNDGHRVWGIASHNVGLKLHQASHIGINLANNTYTWGIYSNSNGNLYFGRRNGDVNDTSGSYFHVFGAGLYTCTGNIVATGEVTAYSDIRLKSNITNLSFRGKLTPKTYIKDGKQSIGFIALEVQQLYPELISISADENHYLSLNYGCITAVLSSQINKVEDEVYVLKNRIKQLEDKLKVYESRVSTFI